MTPQSALRCLCTVVMSSIISAAVATASTDAPRGTLTTAHDMVRADSPTTLNWEIQLPEDTPFTVDPDGTVKPTKKLKMRIRVLGASYQLNSRTYLPVQVYWKKKDDDWKLAFYGYQTELDPSEVLVEKDVDEDDTLDFGGRGYYYGWKPFYSTEQETYNVVALTDGDSVPSTRPAFYQNDIEDFLEPYLNADRSVNLGPRDVIYLIEVGQTNPLVSGFDLQDIVFLVTFEDKDAADDDD